MDNVVSNEELVRAFQIACAHADGYSGNNPGRQRALNRQATDLGHQVSERGVDPGPLRREAEEKGVMGLTRLHKEG